MAVKKIGEKYRCNVCGNEVTVTKVGGGTLVCCGKDMQKNRRIGGTTHEQIS
jgi:desulfoferrodoxin-like iron-binding protein